MPTPSQLIAYLSSPHALPRGVVIDAMKINSTRASHEHLQTGVSVHVGVILTARPP